MLNELTACMVSENIAMDFLEPGSRAASDQALSPLAKRGQLRRQLPDDVKRDLKANITSLPSWMAEIVMQVQGDAA